MAKSQKKQAAELKAAAEKIKTSFNKGSWKPAKESLVRQTQKILKISEAKSTELVEKAESLYVMRMQNRFANIKVSERLKRTNPFLLRIRNVGTVREWAQYQATSTLIASEEEAVGHLLEAIAKICHPNAQPPTYPDDMDYEVVESKLVHGYQVKMSWDCMPMSSRKNLSNTIKKLKAQYKSKGMEFRGYFAPCYGKSKTTQPPGQEYISLSSREFWKMVGGGDTDFDAKVGEVCRLLCSEFRREVSEQLLPKLVSDLTAAANELIGDESGRIDFVKLFKRVNQ